ncbi:BQ2448_1278 [Microbotryum intermedium]|uniref:BQ2448_1278 protein n=1 Tax=Microbotryum intermedium TaxID=269621 RepID=A0A238FDC7_9BASI|nr:BQ2448_1278 [Microbotryum intermedium]
MMDEDEGAAFNSAGASRQPAKRGARACVTCRRLKKTCHPSDTDKNGCKRCEASGLVCTFDRPASSIVDDAGLNRLSAIEATVSTQERRMDTLVQSVGQVSSTLSEILTWLKSGNSPIHHPVQTPPALALSHLQAPSHSAPTLPGFSHHGPASIPPNPPSLQSNPSPKAMTASPNLNASSRLEALASVAVDPHPNQNIDRFATRLHAPIQALADAADQLNSGEEGEIAQERPKDGQGDGQGNQGNPGPEGEEGSQRPKKRSRHSNVGGITSEPSSLQHDVVAKGYVSDREARALILFHHKELHPFCAILDPDHDTFFTLRQHHFLFDVIIYTGLRAQEGNTAASKQLLQVAEHVRETVRGFIFDPSPPVECIQALLIMACWHDEPYILSGFALRLALSARLDTTFAQIDARGWDLKDERARQLTVQLRTWLYCVFLEFKHSRCTDRMIILRQQDVDVLRGNADRLLQMPFSIKNDLRTVANLKLTFIERGIMETGRMLAHEQDVFKHLAYIKETREALTIWHADYDTLLAVHEPSPLSWRRRSHMRHLQEAYFFLPANILGQRLLNPNDSPELIDVGHQALISARTMIRTVLHSPAYAASLKYSGYLMRVDLSFAAMLLLKLAKVYPEASINPEEIVKDVNDLIERQSQCAGGVRFTNLLRIARDQYITSVYSHSPSAEVNNLGAFDNSNSNFHDLRFPKVESPQTSGSIQLRTSIYTSGHYPPTLPGVSFARTDAEFSMPPPPLLSSLPSPSPSSLSAQQQALSATTNSLNKPPPGSGALLPGEKDVIWPDWTGTGGPAGEGMTATSSTNANADWFGGPAGEWMVGVPDPGWPLNWNQLP